MAICRVSFGTECFAAVLCIITITFNAMGMTSLHYYKGCSNFKPCIVSFMDHIMDLSSIDYGHFTSFKAWWIIEKQLP